MEDKQMPLTSSETPAESNVGRRKLLKLIAATSGAVAASLLLPEKWTQPFVQVGTLPAHAQATPLVGRVMIANLRFEMIFEGNGVGALAINQPIPIQLTPLARFEYTDESCNVNAGTKVFLSSTPDGQIIIPGTAIGDIPGSSFGGACTGEMVVPFFPSVQFSNCANISVYIQTVDGRTSNPLTGEFCPFPPNGRDY